MSAINYDLSKIKGMAFDIDGVLSPSTIPIGTDGTPMRMANIKDGYALQLAMRLGLHIAVITGADCPAVAARLRTLGIRDIYLKSTHKLPVLRQWMANHSLRPEEVAYAGDDIPDLPAMLAVGLPVAPADAAVEIKEAAKYICPIAGGHGIARDLIEQTIRAHGKWLDDTEAFGW